MQTRVVLVTFLCLGLLLPAVASAYPNFDVTASEVLSVDPPRVKTTFTITEFGPASGCGWPMFFLSAMTPGAADAPHFFGCSASSSWTCQEVPFDGTTALLYEHNGEGPDSWPSYTFTVVTDQAEPCVRVEYLCVVLMGAPPAPFEACLNVDMPVPVAPSTWGALKSRYR